MTYIYCVYVRICGIVSIVLNGAMLVFGYIQNVKADTFHGPGALVNDPLNKKR